MSLSRQSSYSSISSDSDFEDNYLIRKLHRDYRHEPFYYDGISDDELHSHLNSEFGKVIDSKKYDVAFSSENLLHDDGGDYVIFDPDVNCQINSICFGDFFGDEEGSYRVDDYIIEKNTMSHYQKVFLIQCLKFAKDLHLWIKTISY